MFDRQQGRPLAGHKTRTSGGTLVNATCVCRHNGEVSSQQLLLELRAGSASAWSAAAWGWEPDFQHELATRWSQDELGVGVYVHRRKSASPPPFHESFRSSVKK